MNDILIPFVIGVFIGCAATVQLIRSSPQLKILLVKSDKELRDFVDKDKN